MTAQPPWLTIAFAGGSPTGSPGIYVLAKRTYEVSPTGAAAVAETQLPWCAEQIAEDESDEVLFPALLVESDFWPWKLRTDVVVSGRVHAPGGRPVDRMTAAVTVGAHRKVVAVVGHRRASLQRGRIRFDAPEPFESIELSWSKAYGGIDRSVPLPRVTTMEDLADLFLREITKSLPGIYPRNPRGIGYVVALEEGQSVALPNFEDPARLLDPHDFTVGRPQDWWKMPLPQGFGWVAPSSYPRCLFLGSVPEFAPPDDTDQVEEVRMGLVPKGASSLAAELANQNQIDWRLGNGAAPGLVVPHLEGDERVLLEGFTPGGTVELGLPRDRPAVEIVHRGVPLQVEVAMQTLFLEPDQMRFSIVWGARAAAPEGFPQIRHADLTRSGHLDDFRIHVNGVAVTTQ